MRRYLQSRIHAPRIIGSSLELREVVPDQDKDGKALPVLTGYAAKFNVSHCRWA